MKQKFSKITILGAGLLILVIIRITALVWPENEAVFKTGTDWLTITLIAFAGLVLLKGGYDSLKNRSSGAKLLFSVALLALVGFTITYFTLGERWTKDPLLQKPFDIRTGMPQYMVYETSGGEVVAGRLDGELLHPDDCRPDNVSHEGFNYLKSGTCLSPINNTVRMRPVQPSDELSSTSLRSVLADVWQFIWGENPESIPEERVLGCQPAKAKISLHHLKPGEDMEICVYKGHTYTLLFSQGMAHRASIRFDGARPNGDPRQKSAQPTAADLDDLFAVVHHGNNNRLAYRLTTDTMALKAKNEYLWEQLAPHGFLKLEVYIR